MSFARYMPAVSDHPPGCPISHLITRHCPDQTPSRNPYGSAQIPAPLNAPLVTRHCLSLTPSRTPYGLAQIPGPLDASFITHHCPGPDPFAAPRLPSPVGPSYLNFLWSLHPNGGHRD